MTHERRILHVNDAVDREFWLTYCISCSWHDASHSLREGSTAWAHHLNDNKPPTHAQQIDNWIEKNADLVAITTAQQANKKKGLWRKRN